MSLSCFDLLVEWRFRLLLGRLWNLLRRVDFRNRVLVQLALRLGRGLGLLEPAVEALGCPQDSLLVVVAAAEAAFVRLKSVGGVLRFGFGPAKTHVR